MPYIAFPMVKQFNNPKNNKRNIYSTDQYIENIFVERLLCVLMFPAFF